MSNYTNEELKQHAKSILKYLGNHVNSMIGVKHFSVEETAKGEPALNIRFKSKAKNQSNNVKITLNGNDTYSMKFTSIRGFKELEKGEQTGLYCDMLQSNFEQETGLYLTL